MKSLVFLFVFIFICNLLSSQVPQGINYQACARDGSGNPISGETIDVMVGILSDTTATPVIVREELFSTIKTNSYGMFTLVPGTGTYQSGSVVKFSDIDWVSKPLFLRVKINYKGNWKYLGSAKLWSVPYSFIAGDLAGSVKKLRVTGNEASMDSALFEVRNKIGQTIFAVYNEGVRVYVDNGTKGTKGGFAIGSFDSNKGSSQPYFIVDSDSIRAYVDNNSAQKSNKGGFAIGGFDKTKGTLPFVSLKPKNYFIGQEAGSSNTTGLYNSFIGYQAGKSNQNGNYNIFIGYQTGLNTIGPSGAIGGSEGSFNSYVGYQAGFSNIYGANNTAIGYAAGYNNISDKNTFLGSQSGYGNTSGYSNTFIGTASGHNNTTGTYNVFLGRDAGANVTTGNNNTLIGSGAGANIGAGEKNIIIGAGAMGENYFAGAGTGSSNIIIGFQAGYSAADNSSNIFIGNQAGFSETGSNLLVVSNSSTTTPLLYGNFSSNKMRVNGDIEATGTITTVSDASLKQNITELTGVTEKLDLIRGVYFDWIKSGNTGLLLREGRQIGVIAQEVEKVYPELVIKDDKGYKTMDYTKLTAVLLQAIKEQKLQIQSTQQENNDLRAMIEILQRKVEMIEASLVKPK
jgi:hypothetical protein